MIAKAQNVKAKRLEDLTSGERDALFGAKLSSTSSWNVKADLPTKTLGVPTKISRLTDNLTPADGIPWTLWDFDNLRSYRRVGYSKDNIQYRAFYRDSELLCPDIGFPIAEFNGGVIYGGSVVMQNCEVTSPIDGVWGGDTRVTNGNPVLLDHTRLIGPLIQKFEGFCLAPENFPPTVIGVEGTLKRRMTPSELTAKRIGFVANTAFALGKVIVANSLAWEVCVAGTTGASVAGWPSTAFSTLPASSTAQPYAVKDASGNPTGMKVIGLGGYTHSDGLQTIRNGYFEYQNLWIEQFNNSCMLIQSNGPCQPTTATPPPSMDFAVYDELNPTTGAVVTRNRPNLPAGATWDMNAYGVKIRSCVLQANTNQWIYVNSNGGDADYGNAMYGLYKRDRTSGAWSYWPTVIRLPGKDTGPPGTISRPWGVTVLDTHFRDRLVNTTTNYGARVDPHMYPYGVKPPEAITGKTAGPAGYHGAIWNANDGSLNLPHPVIGNVFNCRGDFAAFVKTEKDRDDAYRRQLNPDGSTNFAVLEQRYQTGLFPGACDARSWIVWSGNYDDRGIELFPRFRNSYGEFDANGYYTGI